MYAIDRCTQCGEERNEHHRLHECEAHRNTSLELPRDLASTRSKQSRANEGWFGKEVLVVKQRKITDYEWRGKTTKHMPPLWVSQSTPDYWRKYAKEWISTVAIDGSFKGVPGAYAAFGHEITQ